MDICTNKWTSTQHSIFSLLCIKAGEKLSQREIAITLNVSPTAVANALPTLLEEKLIIVTKLKNINLVSLNQMEKKAVELKRAENLKLIYVSGLTNTLETELAGATVILFGSYSRGEDITKSDIDIAIIGRTPKELVLIKHEKTLQRKININFYKDFKQINNDLASNICNGIVLTGSITL